MATNQPSAEKISLETINQCSEIVNKSPNLTKVAREKLIGMHRFSKAAAALNPNEEKLIAKIVAAADMLKREDQSEFNSLATFAFNVQVIEATTRQPAAVIAVGAQAKKTFREKGEKPFVTSLIRYYEWIYHPESMKRVRVTDLIRLSLRRSDGVMAKFLSYLIGRSVVYYYAEFRCNNKFTEAEREAINGLIGQVGKQCAKKLRAEPRDLAERPPPPNPNAPSWPFKKQAGTWCWCWCWCWQWSISIASDDKVDSTTAST
eukprot:scaffold272_cov143-Skeletonema_marinoi.AAC.3